MGPKGATHDERRRLAYMSGMARISTPCIRVCLLDRETGLCEGCGRTTDEIARWGTIGEAERLAIMAGLELRMRRAFLPEATCPAPPAQAGGLDRP